MNWTLLRGIFWGIAITALLAYAVMMAITPGSFGGWAS